MRLTLATLVFTLFALAARADCPTDTVSLRGDWGRADFKVEIADTDKSRARGLMFRKSLPRFSGMIFVYDRPIRARFWMKNTYIPLDMLFIGDDGVVKRIHRMAVPESLDTIDGGPGIQMILEINGGMADMLGITEGSEVRYHGFAGTPAWPCE